MSSLSPSPLLTVDALTLSRGPIGLVQALSFTLTPGSILVLRGPNGSGKTSLLRVLAGIARPDAGAVVTGEEAPAYWGHRDGFKGGLTALDNLKQWLRFSGGGDAAAHLSAVGLAARADVPVRFLSAGQRRRLGLARLLGQQARIWLLDEPFTALDTDGRAMVQSLLEAHIASGGCAILALHETFDIKPHTTLTLQPPVTEDAA